MKFYEYYIIIKIILSIILFPLFIKCEEEEIDICSECIFSNEGNAESESIYKCKCQLSETNDDCKCNQEKCRPHLYNNNKCYDCSILKKNNLNLYTISEEEHVCSIAQEISECNKITYEYNECVNDCGTGFELGDYCFKECYNSLGLKEEDESITSSTKKCKCKNFYIEIDINGKKFLKCVDKCPNYYNEITKECVEKCDGTFSRITKNKGCAEKCGELEFLYISNAINEGEKYYCLDKCPDDTRFYYEKKPSEKENICIKKCYDQDFFTIKEGIYYICSSDCDKEALIDLSNNILQCTDKEKFSSCPDIYPYQYQGSCFRNCSDTKNLTYFGNTITYFYNYHNKKICSENCEEYYTENEKTEKDIKYIDQYNLSCVDCKTTNFKYSFGTYCLNTCYTEKEEHPNHLYDTGECFLNCPDDYLLLRENKTCFHKCPSFSDKIFRDNNKKECYTCNIPKNPNIQNYGEGYFIKNIGIDGIEITEDYKEKYFQDKNGNLRCLASCPEEKPCGGENECGTYKFHKNNDNECMFGTNCHSIEGNTFKYSIENQNICYESCKDIPGNFKYEKNFLCSNEPCTHYYYNNSGIFKCIDDETEFLRECTSNGLYYVTKNKECIKNCNKEQYKINYKIENEKIKQLGECLNLNEFTEDLKSKCYYSFTEKICHSECPYRIVKKTSGSTDVEESSNGNCVINCPFDYPYEFEKENKKYCLKECDDYYVNKTGILKCVSNCSSISKFFINGVKQCIDKCEKEINGEKYYYYNKNNECLKSCKDQTTENALIFSLKAETSPQPCIKECPLLFPFYYEDEKICLSDCNNTRNGYIKEKGKNECVSKCQKYIMNGNICSEKCPDDEPFVYESSIAGSIIKKCTSNCQKENANFKYYKYDNSEKISNCLSFCSVNEKIYRNQCLDDCPNGLYEESDKCVAKCSNKPYYQKNNKGVYECKDNCFLVNDYDSIINDDEGKPIKGFISSTQECLNNCPLGENFIGVGNKCKSFCEPLIDGEYYRKIITITNSSSSSYIIYECTKQCKNEEKHLDGTKECILDCPENKPFYNSNDNTCYSLCLKSEFYSYSYEDEHGKNCLPSCLEGKKNYQNDKICVDGCTGVNNIINDKDSSCVNKCDINSSHKYLKTKKYADGKLERHCVDSCTKYTSNDYVCYNNYDDNDDICPEPYNFINGVVCDNKCQENKFAYPKDNNEPPKEYICQNSCADLYYYEKDKICIKTCKDYNIEYTKKCVESCDEISTPDKPYYFYETQTSKLCVENCKDKPFIDIYNKCTEICDDNTPYYIPGENKCKLECPDGYVKIENEYKCLLKCPHDQEDGYIFEDETKTCVKSCKSSKAGYYYYYESDKKCLKTCNINDYIYNDYICVSSCPQDTYIYNKKCIDICPPNQRYYIGNFEHGETNLKKFCLTDCPQEYPFYNIKDDGSAECLSLCPDFYISNKDPIIIGKECVSKCEDIYPYYVKYNNTYKECFEICPKEKPFYVIYGNLDKECFKECPLDNPYHEKNSYECKSACISKYAKYKEKECLSNCEIDNYWIKEENNNITLCVNNCSEIEYTHFSTPDRECVVKCDEKKFLRGKNSLCECMNLFYFNEFGIKTCFDNTIQNCGEKGTASENYPFQINGENQCVEICFGVLSASEDICYLGDFKCPENTEKGIYDGKIKCDCKYKYYIDKKQKKICLNENDQCPNEYNYLIPEKKECVQNCDKYDGYTLVFDNKCFKECPNDMKKTEDEKRCECSHFWYKESDNKYICLNEAEKCPSDFPNLIQDTKECVQKCNKTDYNIYYNETCISSCTGNMIKVEIRQDYPTYSISKYTCRCKNVWAEGECAPNSGDTCNDLKDKELKYLVRETKECVKNCPDYYKSYFNDECFSSCENAEKYGYNLKAKNNSNECECKKYWKIEEDKKICVDKCEYDEVTIEEIKQCSKIDDFNNFACPYNSPYFFNNICYKNCPNGTSIDSTKGNTCKCDDLWFKQGNLIYCPKDKLENCPYNTHPYLIVTTNECVIHKENCSDYKIFNYKCYNECPYLTKANNNNDCECDKNYFWYKYKNSSELREYFECGLKNCTEERPYYINGTNECIKRCGDEGLYEYGNICYKECPAFTQKNTKAYICEFSTESNNLQNLIGNVTNRIVDIYDDLPIGGLVINNEEASLQIYGLKKSDKNNKESIMRANLAYLDLSGCIDKIYESNDMDSKDDIVVVKLDLKSKNSKLIINPIEYEFVNSRNGKVLDASVCERNEVVISYPITYMLNNKKKLRNLEDDENEENLNEEEEKNVDENKENIKKDIFNKFNKGKELNNIDKSIDTFNFNNSIYSDICISVEIEGKDLVLENRIQYLFPNYSFCESVCTYDYTDFEGERIYCNCSIKSGIDTDRPHNVKIYQFNKNETDSYQKGPTNIPILKCVSKAKISGNAAFFFCLVFIIIEIGLLLTIIFYGISSLINKIKEKIINEKYEKDEDKDNSEDRKNNEYNSTESEKIKENKIDKTLKYRNSNNNTSSTKRKIRPIEIKNEANPPKIENGVEEEEDEKNKDDVINIKKVKNKSYKLKEKDLKIDEKNNFDVFSDAVESEVNKYLRKNEIETQTGFFQSMKKEEKLLRTKYNYSLQNDKHDSIIIVLTSIFEKIYIIKILLLSGKFEIIPLMFSLYLLCNMLLLTFVTFFYDIKTIKKIYENENFPNTNYYLSYGFAANLIVWLIFRLFACLLSNDHKIKKVNNMNNLSKKNEKLKKVIYEIKRNMIVYFVLQFLLIMFCSFYLITFCGIYLGTKKRIFQSYGIAVIEIIIIKIIYGFILGVLRKISLYKEIKILYDIVLILNKYIA